MVPLVDAFGAVSLIAPTVVPEIVPDAHGRFVAPEHASLDGLTAIEIEAVLEHPLAVPVIV
jgi:hypothetical protein